MERDRLLQQHENGENRGQIIQLGVWNRDSPAKAGGTQPLPLQKPLRNHLLIKAVSSGGNLGKALKELLLAIDTQPRVERFRPKYIIKMRSEEHTSELQSLMRISYAVFCLKKKKNNTENTREEEDTN